MAEQQDLVTTFFDKLGDWIDTRDGSWGYSARRDAEEALRALLKSVREDNLNQGQTP